MNTKTIYLGDSWSNVDTRPPPPDLPNEDWLAPAVADVKARQAVAALDAADRKAAARGALVATGMLALVAVLLAYGLPLLARL